MEPVEPVLAPSGRAVRVCPGDCRAPTGPYEELLQLVATTILQLVATTILQLVATTSCRILAATGQTCSLLRHSCARLIY